MPDFELFLKKQALFIEKYLDKYVSRLDGAPAILKDAMAYSLQAGGKRLRPTLLLTTAKAFGLKPENAAPAAAAIEMLQTYSLIHDDLPCMDNDSLRRGKPTNHKVFGEDTALLAGDGLLTYVFEIFAEAKAKPENVLKSLAFLARAAGPQGMVGGQVADVFAEGLPANNLKRVKQIKKESKTLAKKNINYFLLPEKNKEISAEAVLKYIHVNKTGALIKASVLCGALLAGAKGKDLENIEIYSENTGLVFQVADDILDVTADAKQLGKSNSDAERGKLTYVSLYGLDYSKNYARLLVSNAKKALDKINNKNLAPLYDMADFFIERTK